MAQKNGKVIDLKRLQILYSGSSVNKEAFDHFASRLNNSRETKVERLQDLLRFKGIEASRKEIIELFRGLEEANCGEFVTGRHGHSSRFAWSVSLVDVGQAAAGETASVDPLTESDRQAEDPEEVSANLLPHRFVLRPGIEVSLPLPRDLTKVEATRLADFVRTLPFGD